MKIEWKRFFKKRSNMDFIENIGSPEDGDKSSIPVRPFDYGLDSLEFVLNSRDFSWKSVEFKKVYLVNPKECENKISIMRLVNAWRGTGHYPWEFIMASWLIYPLLDALKNNLDEADISNLFNRDLFASGGRSFTHEQIYRHIIPYFIIVQNADQVLRLRLRVE